MYSCSGTPVPPMKYSVSVYERTVPIKEPVGVEILDGTGADATLRCNFRYDFNLHDSLVVTWIFNNGNNSAPLNIKQGILIKSL